MFRIAAICLAMSFAFEHTARAALDVFLDFTTDIGNGAGGGANGIADWIDNLAGLATSAGVTPFSAAERATIESNIKTKLEAIYSAYNVTFSTTIPGGLHERLTFGAFAPPGGDLGLAPLDFMNAASSAGTEATASKVFTSNFGFIVDEFPGSTNRATQISQLSAALAGTGAHELGHTVGLRHHHAYGDPAISPANYAATGGVQNTHIIATSITGLGEIGRETDRTFSQMEHLMLEAAGGSVPLFGGTTSLASTVLFQTDSLSGLDVGNTPATARALLLTSLPISLLNAANTLGFLSSDSDVDVYSFVVNGPSRLIAEIWSEERFTDTFDSRIRLIGPDGVAVLASNDDTAYVLNQIYQDTLNAGNFGTNDSSLINILLATAGTYFLEVSSIGNLNGSPGGAYSLIFGVGVDVTAVPEPTSVGILAMGMAAFGWQRWRRRDRTRRP